LTCRFGTPVQVWYAIRDSNPEPIATTFKRTVTDVVCDNTREAALAEIGQAQRVKHSRHSHAQLAPAREALAVVHTIADGLRPRGHSPVRDRRLGPRLGQVPRHPCQPRRPHRCSAEGTLTLADRKRDTLQQLYRHDERVAPWAGYGVRSGPGRQHLAAPTRAQSAEVNGRSGTCFARSLATSARSTAERCGCWRRCSSEDRERSCSGAPLLSSSTVSVVHKRTHMTVPWHRLMWKPS